MRFAEAPGLLFGAMRVPLRRVPRGLQQLALVPVLNHAFREELKAGELDFLCRRCLLIEVRDLGYRWRITRQGPGLGMADDSMPVDLHLAAEARDLVLLATGRTDADALFFQRRLQVSGDTELGLQVKYLLEALQLERLPLPVRAVLDLLGRLSAAAPGTLGPRGAASGHVPREGCSPRSGHARPPSYAVTATAPTR